MPEQVLRIAGFNLLITGMSDAQRRQVEQIYSPFIPRHSPQKKIDTCFNIQYREIPTNLPVSQCLFDSGAAWSLYKNNNNNQFILLLGASSIDAEPYGIAFISPDFNQIEVWIEPLEDNMFTPDPLQFPLGEVLMICLLARGGGVLVHSCGINDNGRGFLFAGNSTHGKSTMAKLWQDHADVLNDDRIILRQHNGTFWMYGTPWHGDYRHVSESGVPVEKIFFLSHGTANHAERKSTLDAVTMLLARTFPPLWDRDGMEYTLSFLSTLSRSLPCYSLSVKPDRDIIDFIRCRQ